MLLSNKTTKKISQGYVVLKIQVTFSRNYYFMSAFRKLLHLFIYKPFNNYIVIFLYLVL